MHLQDVQHGGDTATEDAARRPAAPSPATLPAPGDRPPGLAIPFARGFDAFGTGATLLVHLPSEDEPGAAGPAVASADALPVGPAEPEVPWLVGGLKLVALAVGLGAAYLAGLFLLGAPDGPAPRAAAVQPGPAR